MSHSGWLITHVEICFALVVFLGACLFFKTGSLLFSPFPLQRPLTQVFVTPKQATAGHYQYAAKEYAGHLRSRCASIATLLDLFVSRTLIQSRSHLPGAQAFLQMPLRLHGCSFWADVELKLGKRPWSQERGTTVKDTRYRMYLWPDMYRKIQQSLLDADLVFNVIG